MKNKAINALIEMGAPVGNKGFEYIVDSMVLFETEEIRSGTEMLIFNKIAEMHNTSWRNVERCVRYLFEIIYLNGNSHAVEKHLPIQKTTVKNLLHVFYLRLTQND